MIILEKHYFDDINEQIDKRVTLKYENRALIFEFKEEEGSCYYLTFDNDNYDESVEHSIHAVIEKSAGTDDYGYGLIWGFKDSDGVSYYEFIIAGSGYFQINRKILNGQTDNETLTISDNNGWISHPNVRTGNRINTLEIIEQDGNILFYINDCRVYDLKVSDDINVLMPQGFTIHNTIKIKILSLVIKQREKEIDSVKNLEGKINAGSQNLQIEQDEKAGLTEVFENINKLYGMENIKTELHSLANYLLVQKQRIDLGLAKTTISLHMVLCGPPGTGKTTVARLIGEMYKNLGLLPSGHVIETDRSGLVSQWIGGTALKVDEIVEKAKGGILFIDEAYTLKPENLSYNDTGQEAIETLLKRMEDFRNQFAVIIAGYTDEMQRFLESNPGVKSRFNRYFAFEHYKPDELLQIFEKFCLESNYHLKNEARLKIFELFEVAYEEKDRTFGNGRLARNLFEKIIERQANRVAIYQRQTGDTLNRELLNGIEFNDIPKQL